MNADTVLICGIPSEPTLASVICRLARMRVPFAVINQRQFAGYRMTLRFQLAHLRGRLQTPNGSYDLHRFRSAFLRTMDYRYLPELEHAVPTCRLMRQAVRLHETLNAWANLAALAVLNRPIAMTSNGSKPYQLQLLRSNGFLVPATLVTDEPDLVREFARRHCKVIYKSISSNRSIVRLLSKHDLKRLSDIRSCPTQFQQYIPGFDLRIHTIGSKWVGTAAHTAAVDYRYAQRDGLAVKFERFDGLRDVGKRCIRMAQILGLGLAGFDFRIAGSGEAYCLEVNPMPAFEYYEAQSGQPISLIVAEFLAGRQESS